MKYLEEVNCETPEFGDIYDELPLWSAPFGLMLLEHVTPVLPSCFRAAKAGAGLFLTTNLVGHMSEFYEAYRSVLVELGFADRLVSLDAHIKQRATVDSVRTRLEEAGFSFIEATTRSFSERFIDGSSLLLHHFIRLGFLPAWKSVAPEGAVEATFAALERRLNAIAAKHGELSLTIPTACIHACKPATE